MRDTPIENVLYLPPPLSVNRTRKWDAAYESSVKRWVRHANGLIYEAGGMKRFQKINGQFTATLTLDEHLCNLDLDNSAKLCIDYARQLELVVDDGKRHMREVVIRWGHAPHGCRLNLREIR